MNLKNDSVLFVVGKWTVGGVERVTVDLANAFAQRGLRVAIGAFRFENADLLRELDARVAKYEVGELTFGQESLDFFKEIIQRQGVGFVINQWCVPFKVTRFLRKVTKGTSVKIISVHHNQPNINKRIVDSKSVISRFIWTLISRINLRLVYMYSDAYVLLSPAYIGIFARFVLLRNLRKVYVIGNPISVCVDSSCDGYQSKQNVVLYVGRLEESQKKFSRVIDIWEELQPKISGWKLLVIGDGPDRKMYEAKARKLKDIEFIGFTNPFPYYSQSKLLLMTSDFEGFPMVLVEAIAYKCIPIVYGSFPSVNDIIKGNNGIIVYPPWDTKPFVHELYDLIGNKMRMVNMANAGHNILTEYSIEFVCNRYLNMMNSL